MSHEETLQATIAELVGNARGILAADESVPTLTRRFEAVGVEPSEENRRAYRALLVTTPGLGDYISGVILFEETLAQKTADGVPLPRAASNQHIVPGIKVDKGTLPLALSPGDAVTQGLDGLATRLAGYREQGARFAKWRATYNIGDGLPGHAAVLANAEMLARYAAICQSEGFVPIVEPEVLMDGAHTLGRCAEVTEKVLQAVFQALQRHHVALEYILLKPSMVVPGKGAPKAEPMTVAEATLKVLRRTVPPAVPSLNFLSGGQGPEEATANLDALNRQPGPTPWQLSLSYGRALQEPVLATWRGRPQNVAAAQQALLKRARLNSLAMRGSYTAEME